MLSRLSGPLCDAVTERNDSEHLLAELVRANLFLQPLDESGQLAQWYRYHPLFAEVMQHEVRHRFREDVKEVTAAQLEQVG